MSMSNNRRRAIEPPVENENSDLLAQLQNLNLQSLEHAFNITLGKRVATIPNLPVEPGATSGQTFTKTHHCWELKLVFGGSEQDSLW